MGYEWAIIAGVESALPIRLHIADLAHVGDRVAVTFADHGVGIAHVQRDVGRAIGVAGVDLGAQGGVARGDAEHDAQAGCGQAVGIDVAQRGQRAVGRDAVSSLMRAVSKAT